MNSTPGRIVLLNGASSSGKSSLARELLEVFDDPWFHLPVDAFGAMRARKDLPRPELDALLKRTRQGYHRAVAGMARAGNSVVRTVSRPPGRSTGWSLRVGDAA